MQNTKYTPVNSEACMLENMGLSEKLYDFNGIVCLFNIFDSSYIVAQGF